MSSMYHLAALHGNVRLLKRGIEEDADLLSKHFQCSDLCLVEDCELDDTEYVPPPLLPRLVRAALHNCNDLLDETVGCDYGTFGLLSRQLPLDQRWLISFGFGHAPLLHYACAGNRLDAVKLLLSMGSDVQAVNAVHRRAEEYTTSGAILELLRPPLLIGSSHDNKVNGNTEGLPLRNGLRSPQDTKTMLPSKKSAQYIQLDQVQPSLRRNLDCAEGSSPVPAATSNKSRHRKLRKQRKVAATIHATDSERRLTIMKRLSVAPTTSEQTSFDSRVFGHSEEPLSVAPPMNYVSPSHNASASLQDSREYPTAMDLLEALFPMRRINKAVAASAEAKVGPLDTSMVALFRKLVPLEEVAAAALLGKEATGVIIPPSSRVQQHSTDCSLLNAVISNTIAVHRDQEDELDQVIHEINEELQLRDKINDQQQQQHQSSTPIKQSGSYKVTCKELIWRRAGVYLDSPLTGRMKQEHVQLKRDALSRGLRVLEVSLGKDEEQWAALERLVVGPDGES